MLSQVDSFRSFAVAPSVVVRSRTFHPRRGGSAVFPARHSDILNRGVGFHQ